MSVTRFLLLGFLLWMGAIRCQAVQADDRLNVLMIVSDDLNCDLGCYGHPLVQSPHIDRLAARGVRFLQSYCQYPLCNPSRSSFMTGMYPEQTGVLTNIASFRKKNPDVVTLPQLFQQAGYYVARVGKIYHYGVPLQIGTDGMDDPASWMEVVNPRGLDREVHDRIHSLVPGRFGGALSWLELDTDDEHQTDGIGALAAIELLKRHHPRKTGKPFFLAVGFYRPHTPYVAPSRYFQLYDRDRIEPVMEKLGDRDDIPLAALVDRPHQRELSVAKRKVIIQAYYASISYMDAQVGRVLDALQDLDLDQKTIVLFTSDHGYHLGQHGLWQKGDLFEEACRVPLIVSVPSMKTAGQASKALTEMVDIYPTLADLCGLTPPKTVQGNSLRSILDDPRSQPGKEGALSVTISRAYRMHKEIKKKDIIGHSIRTPRYRYTEWDAGEFGVELYDYQSDPEEYTNLARVPGNEELLKRMKQLLDNKRARAR